MSSCYIEQSIMACYFMYLFYVVCYMSNLTMSLAFMFISNIYLSFSGYKLRHMSDVLARVLSLKNGVRVIHDDELSPYR